MGIILNGNYSLQMPIYRKWSTEKKKLYTFHSAPPHTHTFIDDDHFVEMFFFYSRARVRKKKDTNS